MPIGTPVGNLDIANATLRTSNLETQNIKIGSIFVNSYPGLETTANVGNSMSNTIQFTNTHTAFTTTGNVTVGKELTVTGNATFSGTGALTVPTGTTEQQPTGVAGMIRFNSTLNRLEVYNGTVWHRPRRDKCNWWNCYDKRWIQNSYIHGRRAIHLQCISGGEVEYLVVAGGGRWFQYK